VVEIILTMAKILECDRKMIPSVNFLLFCHFTK